MKNQKIITGIDVGTTKIAVIIAEIDNESINILGFGENISEGLRRGIVVDIDKTSNSIEEAITKAEKQAELEIDSAFIGITGEHVKGINCSGTITISNNEYMNPAGEKITKEDIKKVLESAEAINLPPQRKILHTLSREFKVDDNSNIINPEGLSGHRLEANVHLVTIARNIETNLKTCLERVGIEFDGLLLEPLASASSVLDNHEKHLGVALIDIGGGTTDIIFYNNKSVLHTAAIPLGGESLTNDIALGLTITLEQAERLKCKHGLAKEALASDENDIIIVGTNGRNDSKISQGKLSAIIEARMKEIFVLTKSEIRRVENECHLNFGVVITGGGSNLKNIEDLAIEVFELNVQKGIPNSINGIDDIINNPKYATTVGLIKYIAENNDLRIKKSDDDLDLLDIIKQYYKKFIGYLKLK